MIEHTTRMENALGAAQSKNVLRWIDEARRLVEEAEGAEYDPEVMERLNEAKRALPVVRATLRGPILALTNRIQEREANNLKPDPAAEAEIAELSVLGDDLHGLLVLVGLRGAEMSLRLSEELLPDLEERFADLAPKLDKAEKRLAAAQEAYERLQDEFSPVKQERDSRLSQKEKAESELATLREEVNSLDLN